MQIARALINMTWRRGAKCKKEEEEAYLQAWGAASEEEGGWGADGVIKSSGTLSLPGLGWLPVNRRGQSGFIGYV